MSLIARGTSGTMYQLNIFIAVKRARKGEDEQADHANEPQISPTASSSHSLFLSQAERYLLEFAPNDSVAMVLSKKPKRDGIRVLEVF